MTPRITTIVPTYRRPVLLRRAVLSVLNQSYSDFVVTILDNASGDETEDVARALMREDSRVEYHRHDKNIGSLQNMIYGMSRVTTPYFSILCDDDLLMPDFLRTGLDVHDRAQEALAFVATRVVLVDETGQFQNPHPHEACRFAPPDGVMRCVTRGVSLPGAVYRTSAIQSIGMPRTTWWNWTESGWHALAAINFPIELSPIVGAVVFVHADSGSKRMNVPEFRLSWFQMLSELHGAVTRRAVGETWWREHVLPVAYPRFVGTLVRLCNREGASKYDTLAALGVASGLNAHGVSGGIRVARAASALGMGEPLNRALDGMIALKGHVTRAFGRSEAVSHDAGIQAASRVFLDLNRQVGLA